MKSLILRLSKVFPQSLVAEIYRIFGLELAEKLLTIFAGTTIQIPTTKEMEEALRDLSIYETLRNSKSGAESRRLGKLLCEQHGLKRREMRKIYKVTKRKLKETKRFTESDQQVGKHLPKQVRVKRKSKRKL